MKVKELIEKLKELDQEAMVIRHGYEGGYDEVKVAREVDVILDVNTDSWYYGDHEILEDIFESEQINVSTVKGVLVS